MINVIMAGIAFKLICVVSTNVVGICLLKKCL
nr:MAG TPA: hypothetical protein [Caudoviricetes sp.]